MSAPVPLDAPRCQSCGMPLGSFQTPSGESVANYGTDADNFPIPDYCFFCFREGSFVEPNLTLSIMLNRAVQQMTAERGLTDEAARTIALGVIPGLLRWNHAQRT